MGFRSVLWTIVVGFSLSSCGVLSVSTVGYRDPAAVAQASPYAVTGVNISVPKALTVSEEDVYYPVADIVWRGDPMGDRHDQIAAIFAEAAARGTVLLTKGRRVVADVTVTRFHALTEKTRYSIGGVYSISYDLTLRDVATGDIVKGPERIIADIPAWGGRRALLLDMAGRTPKVIILEELTLSIRNAIADPDARKGEGVSWPD